MCQSQFKLVIYTLFLVPAILREAVPSTIDNVRGEYENVSSTIYEYTGWLVYVWFTERTDTVFLCLILDGRVLFALGRAELQS